MADDGSRVGPTLKDALRQAWYRGSLHWRSLCWAAGWAHWRPLCVVRELRWAMARGAPLMTPAQVGCRSGGSQFRE